MGVPGGIERPAGVSTAAAVALLATLGLAAAAWVVAAWQMSGMAMGVATRLGSFGFFIAVWVAMMAAMMLPGLAPAVPAAQGRHRRAGGAGDHRARPPDPRRARRGSRPHPADVTFSPSA